MRASLERTDRTMRAYIESADFRARHGEAYAKWTQAAFLLAADPLENATRIGHDCREAMAGFAASLVALHGVAPDGKGTYTQIKAVIDSHRGSIGTTRRGLLAALSKLWQATNVGRTSRSTARSGTVSLEHNQAAHCVFYTGLVMYELDRTLGT